MTKPGGLILVGEPFWTKEPDDALLAAEKYTRDMFGTHYDNVLVGEDEGLSPLYTTVSGLRMIGTGTRRFSGMRPRSMPEIIRTTLMCRRYWLALQRDERAICNGVVIRLVGRCICLERLPTSINDQTQVSKPGECYVACHHRTRTHMSSRDPELRVSEYQNSCTTCSRRANNASLLIGRLSPHVKLCAIVFACTIERNRRISSRGCNWQGASLLRR
jgi:hypothetical protein